MTKISNIKAFAFILALGTLVLGVGVGFFLRQCFQDGKCQFLNRCFIPFMFDTCVECWGWAIFTAGLVITVVGIMLVIGYRWKNWRI
jgi:hypothetical protein